MTVRVHVEQDGRAFYILDLIEDKIIDTWTAKDNRRGDTTENAIAWRDMFVAYYVSRGFYPTFL